ATAHGKQPYFIHRGDEGIAMAGIIRPWLDRARDIDDPLRWRPAMSIITLDAHVAPGEVHDRMPAFITRDSVDDWLGGHLDDAERLDLLHRSSSEVAGQLRYHAVSQAVNSVRNDSPRLVEPVEELPEP